MAANPATPPAPLPQLGQYQLVEMLGQGGMGTVYRAVHARLKKTVAIKVLASGRERESGWLQRFHREMEILGQLSHPNIVSATDAGESDGTHYLVMELIEGVDLGNLLRRHSTFGISEACELARQTALGLQYAADRGLVHRDIKPSNLMLTSVGRLKILDLGLARLRHDLSAPTSGLTTEGRIVGTLDYMAPEQARETRQLDPRADIYSLGCTLYEMLSGAAPFHGSATAVEKLLAHQNEAPVPLSQRNPAIPTALESIVSRMLAKRPEDRHSHPQEVADALTTFSSGAELKRLLATTPGGPIPVENGPPSAEPSKREAAVTPAESSRSDWRQQSTLLLTNPERQRPPRLPSGRHVLFGSLALALLLGVGTYVFTRTPGARSQRHSKTPEDLSIAEANKAGSVEMPRERDEPEPAEGNPAKAASGNAKRPLSKTLEVRLPEPQEEGASAPGYRMTIIDPFPDPASSCKLEDINERGEIVGTCSGPRSSELFLISDGTLKTIPIPADRTAAVRRVLNDGRIVGYLQTRREPYIDTPFVLPRGASLQTSEQAPMTVFDGNESGVLVGYTRGLASSMRAARSVDGAVSNLSLPDGVVGSVAKAVNERGVIVIQATFPGQVDKYRTETYRIEGAKFVRLESLRGSQHTVPKDINDAGAVIGTHLIQATATVRLVSPYLDENGAMKELPLLPGFDQGEPARINARGQIVGRCFRKLPPKGIRIEDSHAFLYDGARTIDLHPKGWATSVATSINDRGQIIGWGSRANEKRTVGFLLDPIGRSPRNLANREPPRVEDLHIRILGRLDGATSVLASALNNRGQVVGACFLEDGRSVGFLWTDGKISRVGPEDQHSSRANDINDEGQIAGSLRTRDGETYEAVKFLGPDFLRLAPEYAGFPGEVNRINAHGHVTGSISVERRGERKWGRPRTFFHDGRKLSFVDDLPNEQSSQPYGLSDHGQIVGAAMVGGLNIRYENGNILQSAWRPFLSSRGGPKTVMEFPPNVDSALAVAVNDHGWIVGSGTRSNAQPATPGARVAILWKEGRPTLISAAKDFNCTAAAVDRTGLVVGHTTSPAGVDRAFAFRDGTLSDLHPPGWHRSSAVDINDSGVILGRGSRTQDGPTESFLMEPRTKGAPGDSP